MLEKIQLESAAIFFNQIVNIDTVKMHEIESRLEFIRDDLHRLLNLGSDKKRSYDSIVEARKMHATNNDYFSYAKCELYLLRLYDDNMIEVMKSIECDIPSPMRERSGLVM